MAGTTLLVGILAALAVGFLWLGVDARRQHRQAAARIDRSIAPHLLAPTMELQAPFSERVLEPLLRGFLRTLGRLSPGRNIENLRHQLLVAGSPAGLGPLDFLGLRLLITVLGTALVAVLVLRSPAPLSRRLVLFGGGFLLSSQLPMYWLRRQMRLRRKAITLALADALDMLTVCVDAGMALEASFMRIGELWEHALAQEFRRAVMEMGVGVSWREAMRNLVYRTDAPDLSSMVAVLLQADQLGFSISDTLHAQADQLRVRRRQRAQEMARAAPFKMLFPMIFLIMPATFAVVIGPAIPAILSALGGR